MLFHWVSSFCGFLCIEARISYISTIVILKNEKIHWYLDEKSDIIRKEGGAADGAEKKKATASPKKVKWLLRSCL
jgi:hypothetical protein